MRCRINGQEVDPQLLARRSMNFGQDLSEEPALSCEIALPTTEFIATLRDEYNRAVREEIADAPYHQIGEWPLLDRLQNLGYPPLDELVIKEPELLAELAREWLTLEVLDLLIPGSAAGLPKYLVNTIDQVTVDQQFVRIRGQAYPHPMLVQQA